MILVIDNQLINYHINLENQIRNSFIYQFTGQIRLINIIFNIYLKIMTLNSENMIYRNLGKTGLRVSAVSFGNMINFKEENK